MRLFFAFMAITFLSFGMLFSWEGPAEIWTDGNVRTIESVGKLTLTKGVATVIISSWEPHMPPEDPNPPQYLVLRWTGAGWTEPDSLKVPLRPYGGGKLLVDHKERFWYLWTQGTGMKGEPAYLLASRREGNEWVETSTVYEIAPGIQTLGGGAILEDSQGRIWWIIDHSWVGQVPDLDFHIWAFIYEGGEWTGPFILVESSCSDLRPVAAADDRGGVWIAWRRDNKQTGESSLLTKYLGRDGWSEEMSIALPDSSKFYIESPTDLTVDSNGDPWLAFILYYRDDMLAAVSRFDWREEEWGIPWVLGRHAYSDSSDIGVNIVGGPNGGVWLAWLVKPILSWFGMCGRIMLSHWGGQWSVPEIIAPDFQNTTPGILLEGGRIWLAWTHENTPGTPGETNTPLYAYQDLLTGIEDNAPGGRLPHAVSLSQNYPNPFNPLTSISFELPGGVDEAELIIYSLRGKVMKVFSLARPAAGRHTLTWDGRDGEGRKAPSGIYFYRISAGGETATRKMLLLY